MVCKYKETSTFHFHNANPKGKNANDCVARAISVALSQSWEDTIREMTELGIELGFAFNEDKLVSKFLRNKGFEEFKEPRDIKNKKITINQFINKHGNDEGIIVAKVGSHHISLIIDGVVWDTWDCSKKIIHTYWKLPTEQTTKAIVELGEEYNQVMNERLVGNLAPSKRRVLL